MENFINLNFQLILVISLILIALHLIFSLINRSKVNASNSAEMALSLGILGTFCGIVFGLIKFDVSDIQGSIPLLLEGLKFAFITSIAGMVSSILIKFFAVKAEGSSSEATPETIQAELSRINDTLKKNNIELKDEFKKLISGGGDDSLVSQIKLLKNDLVEQLKENKDLNKSGFEELNNQFTQLGEKIAKLSSDAMVEALKTAIVEFNKQLAEQLGDNFRQLNEGVKNLLEWQDQYKGTVEKMQNSIGVIIEHLNDATEAIRQISGSLEPIPERIEEISTSLEPIPETVQTIERLFKNTENAIGLLNTTLESFSEIRKNATEAFPIIEENLQNITTKFNQMGETLSETITENSTKINDTLSTSFERMSSNLADAATQSGQLIKDSISDLDEKMQNELTRSIQLLTNGLASLSEKFVNDYTPLTTELQKLVRIAKDIEEQ